MSGEGRFARASVHVFGSSVLAFLLLPILAVVPASFNYGSFIRLPPETWSTRWYLRFFADREWLTSLATSIEVATIAALVSVALGTAAALGLARMTGRLRAILLGLILGPMIVPVIVLAVSLYYIGRYWGLTGTLSGLALAHVLICMPFVVLNVSVSLRALDPSWLRAAEGLGASPARVFLTVTLPTILPGLLGGAVFALISSFDEVVLSIFLAGVQTKTLPVKMWEVVRLEFTPILSVASTLLILVTVVLFVLFRLAAPRAGASASP
ncbi:MAG: ABC transporter permease [Proteobacteria bacterium]|nr:ABC transporter permease [Pseudomonadota bacterium]MBI3497929.1 ABC transporter permease [Pseudomonadota bacterium]